jgi:hypothetical protein
MRLDENLNNVASTSACFGKVASVVKQRNTIKRQTIECRRLQRRKLAVYHESQNNDCSPQNYDPSYAKCTGVGQPT